MPRDDAFVVIALGSIALLLGTLGYRTFARHRLRRRFRVESVSAEWLAEQRRER